MTMDPSPSESAGWLDQATRILENLGFELLDPDRTRGEEAGHLVVALRPQPTLAHFDPEKIDYWVGEGGKGRASTLDRETHLPLAIQYAWGRITLTDRLGIHNEFLSFGGVMRAQMTSETTVIADFGSRAPILRWSGHSQNPDPLSAEVGAFFARLKIPIDFAPGAESLIAGASPIVLYCSFVQYVRERLAQARTLRDANRWLADWSAREAQRLQAASAEQWAGATELRKQLSAVEAIARE